MTTTTTTKINTTTTFGLQIIFDQKEISILLMIVSSHEVDAVLGRRWTPI